MRQKEEEPSSLPSNYSDSRLIATPVWSFENRIQIILTSYNIISYCLQCVVLSWIQSENNKNIDMVRIWLDKIFRFLDPTNKG